MPDKDNISVTLPHDPEVKSFPFSDLPISEKINKIYTALKNEGILGKLEQTRFFSDIPQFYVYTCERSSGKNKVNELYGFGGSEDEGDAITYSIGEAIEHYCILHERENLFVHGTYNELKSRAIDPLRFVPFTPGQLSKAKYAKFSVTHNKALNWLEGYSLTHKKKVLVPASLAYANYVPGQHNEPGIRKPISTGAACGPSLDFAISRGISEIIERDSYLISFLPEMPKKLITFDKADKELSDFLNRFSRYNLELYFIDTTLDSQIFSVVCLLVDRSGSGPAVCAGLGGGLEPIRAIKTSAIEAIRRYVSSRNYFFRTVNRKPLKKYSFDWFVKKKRQLWSAPHMIRLVENVIKNAQKVNLPPGTLFKTDKEKVNFLTNKLNEIGCEVIYVDMTIPEVAKQGLRVVKVLCPEMVPLCYDERYPYLGMNRLADVPKKYGVHTNLDLSVEDLINIHPF